METPEPALHPGLQQLEGVGGRQHTATHLEAGQLSHHLSHMDEGREAAEDLPVPLAHVPPPAVGDGVAKPEVHGVGPLDVPELDVAEAGQLGGDGGPDIGLQGCHGEPPETPEAGQREQGAGVPRAQADGQGGPQGGVATGCRPLPGTEEGQGKSHLSLGIRSI